MEEETKEKEQIKEVDPAVEEPIEDDEDSEAYSPEYRFLLKSLREYREYKEEVKKIMEARISDREALKDQLAIPRTFTRRRDIDIDSLGTIVDAFPHEFPWIVRLGRNRADLATNLVAGTLISPYYVVTAAQNVAYWLYQDIYVGLGIHNLNSFRDKTEGFKIKVKRMIVNKECSKKGKTEITHDIAIIELAKPAKIGEEYNVAAIALPNRK
ncbi:hypothetical protein O3M35_010229 [Rhynocoris fuscipes]|uniref:Peptidase S1 domain-containing protein n=1 Tax=Rhynocoris fuscipes TaxID=488301 RepID=A0AAW1CY40_9HEMI